MEIAYHFGAHSTDEGRLMKALLKNREMLSRKGIIVPPPGRYRVALRKTVEALAGAPADEDTQEKLLDAMVEEDHPHRIVLFNENFLTTIPRIFDGSTWYENAGQKTAGLANLFPAADAQIFMAIRNPATLLPALAARAPEGDYAGLLQGADPMALRWSEVIGRMRAEAPGASLTVWCNEDTPLIWAQLLQELAGVESMTPMEGQDDLLAEIMTPEGLQRCREYLRTRPPATEVQRRKVIAAFLDKFAIPEELEETVDIPGWDEATVEALTEAYDEDVYAISRMEGVTLVTP